MFIRKIIRNALRILCSSKYKRYPQNKEFPAHPVMDLNKPSTRRGFFLYPSQQQWLTNCALTNWSEGNPMWDLVQFLFFFRAVSVSEVISGKLVGEVTEYSRANKLLPRTFWCRRVQFFLRVREILRKNWSSRNTTYRICEIKTSRIHRHIAKISGQYRRFVKLSLAKTNYREDKLPCLKNLRVDSGATLLSYVFHTLDMNFLQQEFSRLGLMSVNHKNVTETYRTGENHKNITRTGENGCEILKAETNKPAEKCCNSKMGHHIEEGIDTYLAKLRSNVAHNAAEVSLLKPNNVTNRPSSAIRKTTIYKPSIITNGCYGSMRVDDTAPKKPNSCENYINTADDRRPNSARLAVDDYKEVTRTDVSDDSASDDTSDHSSDHSSEDGCSMSGIIEIDNICDPAFSRCSHGSPKKSYFSDQRDGSPVWQGYECHEFYDNSE